MSVCFPGGKGVSWRWRLEVARESLWRVFRERVLERVCRFDELAIEGVLDWSAIWRWFGIVEGVAGEGEGRSEAREEDEAEEGDG